VFRLGGSSRADFRLLQSEGCRMLIEDMVDLGEDHGDDKTGLCNPGLGDEGRVGKDGEADTLLSCKAGPSIWIVVGKRSTTLIKINFLDVNSLSLIKE